MNISELQDFCSRGAVRWTGHVLTRLLQRGISRAAVLQAVSRGEIIEQYPDDYPYPSCLLLGYTDAGEPLHAVCGLTESELWLITVYRPSPADWESDLKTRRNTPK